MSDMTREAFEPRRPIDANELERIAKDRPDDYFLKGSGVLKLTGAIRQLEAELRAARAQAAPAVEPKGWKLVPEVPNQSMVHAAKEVDGRLSVFKWADGYYAMLAAAPQSAQEGEPS